MPELVVDSLQTFLLVAGTVLAFATYLANEQERRNAIVQRQADARDAIVVRRLEALALIVAQFGAAAISMALYLDDRDRVLGDPLTARPTEEPGDDPIVPKSSDEPRIPDHRAYPPGSWSPFPQWSIACRHLQSALATLTNDLPATRALLEMDARELVRKDDNPVDKAMVEITASLHSLAR